MKSSRLFGALVLVVALALGVLAPLTAFADPSHPVETPVGVPGGADAGDPDPTGGSGIVWTPPAPLSLPELVVQIRTKICLACVSCLERPISAERGLRPVRLHGSTRQRGSSRR